MYWVGKAWTISAICVLAILVLLRYLTPWGRQFWRITRAYFVGPNSVRVWLMLGVLLLSVVLAVRLNVLFSYQGNDMYTALQKAFEGIASGDGTVKRSGVRGFWMSIGVFSVMAVLHVTRVMADIYLTQRFIIAWRVWLTHHLTQDWLDGRAYYRDLFIDETIDNPDQRIQQDVDIFTAGAGGTPNAPSNGTASTLLFGAVQSIISVISFTAILWNLSGTLNIFGVSIPRAMFWTVLVYVFVATVISFIIGRPLIWLSFRNEKLNAAFRYALVRLRDAAEAVGFYRGERVEGTQLQRRFTPVIDNYRRYVRRSIAFNGWNLSVSQTIVPLPWVIQAPRLFAGQIDFGDVGQTATSFGNIHDLVVVLPQQLRRVCVLPRSNHPIAWAGRRQRERPRPARGPDPTERRRVRRAQRHRGAYACRRSVDRPARCAAGPRRLAGDHRAFWGRQDHAAAQSGGTVALRIGDPAPAGRRERDDVLVAVAVCAAGDAA
ncbi:putative drugs-transport transmembrane ATP-binding protein ABC transporter [Mycobacterium tuberculosis CCDC5079]|nr:putative drugs-transport transmembrane ATP-binding protein ABC transporter [Mycobacterium tuberculosis CCDC5079]